MELLLAVAVVVFIAAVVGSVGILIGRRLAPGIERWTAGGEENVEGETRDDDEE